MIKNKYAWKQWLSKNYPDIQAEAIYGLNAYVLNKPLEPTDAYIYMQQELANGKYIAFIGLSPEEVQTLLTEIKEHGIPSKGTTASPHDTTNGTTKGDDAALINEAPTTFSSFENWILRHGIKYIRRVFAAHRTPYDIFCTDTDEDGTKILSCYTQRTWYVYEFAISDEGTLINKQLFRKSPHRMMTNKDGTQTLVVMIKASSSMYKSKRQRFAEKFTVMQPLYEQLIQALITDDDDMVQAVAKTYLGIQFQVEATTIDVDVERIKEEWQNGTLQLYLRTPVAYRLKTDEADNTELL